MVVESPAAARLWPGPTQAWCYTSVILAFTLAAHPPGRVSNLLPGGECQGGGKGKGINCSEEAETHQEESGASGITSLLSILAF
ncbi:TCF3 fusion partner [Platysternon megacephalum]|uniref:TCF3 fusion partner n=1 Tax=Platysternon megacephalum TaxID=55544 RepID=A0A4D9DQY2_9SAUR|nr:TCF3 fusion partner [Platysternon megacephalum]